MIFPVDIEFRKSVNMTKDHPCFTTGMVSNFMKEFFRKMIQIPGS